MLQRPQIRATLRCGPAALDAPAISAQLLGLGLAFGPHLCGDFAQQRFHSHCSVDHERLLVKPQREQLLR